MCKKKEVYLGLKCFSLLSQRTNERYNNFHKMYHLKTSKDSKVRTLKLCLTDVNSFYSLKTIDAVQMKYVPTMYQNYISIFLNV